MITKFIHIQSTKINHNPLYNNEIVHKINAYNKKLNDILK